MSTVTRGNSFEDRVFTAIKSELTGDKLCVSPNAASIYRKKPYFSRDREAEIITDISIEVFLPNRKKPSLIWIFECKDYSGSIPVDDVEEFHAKIQQISEDNTKGTLVVTGALQHSALTYARSKGIGIIRLLPDDQVEHLLEYLTADSIARLQFNATEVLPALMIPTYRSRNSFFAQVDEYVYGNWYSLISRTLKKITCDA
jgi:hypothetical protein